nr:AMIN domain-containing protein [Desulfobaculum xiamenense]
MQAPAPVATAPAPTPLASNTTRTAQAPKPLPTAPPATQKAAPAVPASPTQRPKQPTSPAVATTIASADGARVVTITLRSTAPIESVRSYLLADPPRLVVDLPGTWEYRGATRIPVDKGIVRAVRTGIHADKLRVVLDLTAPPSRKPTVQKSDDGLSILVPPSS